jgi:hypothetical protein
MTTPSNVHLDIQYTWAATPLSLLPTPLHLTNNRDAYTQAATAKTLLTNMLLRALNSIYLQAPNIPAHLYNDFTSYSLAVYQCLSAHHRAEEEFLFPEIERRTGETSMRDQHLLFHPGARAWGKWLASVLTRWNNFSPDTCNRLMDGFLTPLHAHLSDSIVALSSLSRFGNTLDIKELSRKESEHVLRRLSKMAEMPAMLCNHDVTFERGKHPLDKVPGVSNWLLRHFYSRSRRSWWRFATCGRDGRPRRLEFEEGGEGEGREMNGIRRIALSVLSMD